MGRLDGKVAIITGAGAGQGAAEAELFAREGAKVIATDVNLTAVERVVSAINAARPGAAVGLRHDVSSESDWASILDEGRRHFGVVTVLVNNAGIPSLASYDETSHAYWSNTIDVNAWGQFVGIQKVVPGMKTAGGGSIINVSSLAAINACGRFTAYTASKGAITAFSRAAAIDLAEFNIRVNAICPGMIQTQMVDTAFPSREALDEAVSAQPLRRLGQPVDVAYLAVYLASDESSFTTGTSQVIDGGLSVAGGVRPQVSAG